MWYDLVREAKRKRVNYEISLIETICALLELPGKEGEKGAESLFKTISAGDSQI